MSKLSGRKVVYKKYKLGEVEINLKPVPFGRIIAIQEQYRNITNDSEKDQFEFIKKILLEYTDLEEDDLSDADYAITIDEAEGLFNALLAEAMNPKVTGQLPK